MNRLLRQDRLAWVLLASTCIVLTACEQVPPLGNMQRESPVESAFNEEGRGGYDWPVTRSRFEIPRHSKFTYFGRIDQNVFSTAGEIALFEENELGSQVRPAGMDEDVFSWLLRCTEPNESTEPIFSVPVNADVQPNGFDVDASGERLLTIGRKIQIWDIGQQRVLHSYPNPDPKIRRAILADDGTSFTTVSSESVDLFSVPDGSKQSSWSSPDAIESVSVARDGSTYCIITRSRMFALDDQLKLIATYRGQPLSNSFSAVQPEGKWILANTGAGPVRWHLDGADRRAEILSADRYDPEFSRCLSGTTVDRWMGHAIANVYHGDDWFRPGGGSRGSFQLNPRILWAQDCTVDGTQGWSLILGEQLDQQNQRRVLLQDVSLTEYSWSEPIVLDDIPVALAANQTGERIAIGSDDTIDVIRRRRWVDPFAHLTVKKARFLFGLGRIDQVELFAAQIRKQPRLRYNMTGESIYGEIIQGLGAEWSRMKLGDTAPDVLKKIEDWHSAGGELASAASIARHISSGRAARGSGAGNTIPQRRAVAPRQKINVALRELTDLLAQDHPPAYAFEALFTAMQASTHEHLDAEPYLERYVNLYPAEIIGHANLANWLLPKWGGDDGASGAYLERLAQSYPNSSSDLVYARNVLYFRRLLYGSDIELSRFSFNKLFRGGAQMMDKGYLMPTGAGYLMHFARTNSDLVLLRRIADYHVREFATLHWQNYNAVSYDFIYEARQNAVKVMQSDGRDGPSRMLPN